MSANLKDDLEEVKRAFEKFRSERKGKERIPERLWAAAVELLSDYPINVVWRELQLKPEYLKMKAGLTILSWFSGKWEPSRSAKVRS